MADYIQTGISTIKELFTFFNERSRTADRLKKNILRELRDNIKLLEHRNKEGVQVNVILQTLSAKAISEAYQQNYNFNQLSDGLHKLPANLISHKQQEKYIGWTPEKFMENIEGKINDLRNLPVLYPDLSKAPILLHVRLDNLYYQLVLFGLFISRKS